MKAHKRLTRAEARQMDEIAATLIVERILEAPKMELASLTFPLFKVTKADIAKAEKAWRRKNKRSRIVFDLGEQNSFGHWRFGYMVRYYAGQCAWDVLESVEGMTSEEIAAHLGIAISVELADLGEDTTNITYAGRRKIKALIRKPTDLCLLLLEILQELCQDNSWNASSHLGVLAGERRSVLRVCRSLLRNLKARQAFELNAKALRRRAA